MKNGVIEKCVLVINEDLPLGIIANTAAIMDSRWAGSFQRPSGRMSWTGQEGSILESSAYRSRF